MAGPARQKGTPPMSRTWHDRDRVLTGRKALAFNVTLGIIAWCALIWWAVTR